MTEMTPQKKVDESWKERVEHEKQHEPTGSTSAQPAPAGASGGLGPEPAPQTQSQATAENPEARFDLFLSSLAMEALIALGEVPNPVTRKQAMNLAHARYIIDILGILEQKTRGNLSVDEERLLKDTVYQLRMRYLAKAGG